MKIITEKIIWKGIETLNTFIKLKNTENINPISQISAICFDENNKILLIKDPNKSFWMLPGGTPEKNEKMGDTLKREVDEEASCEIESPNLIGAIKVEYPNNPNKEEGEVFYQLRYFAKIKKINPLTIDPDRGYKHKRTFVSPEEFIEKVTWKETAKEILKEINNLSI